MRVIQGQGASRLTSDVDVDLLRKADRSEFSGKCSMRGIEFVLFKSLVPYNFSATTTTLDLASALPLNDFLLTPWCWFEVVSAQISTTASPNRWLDVELGILDTSANFRQIIKERLLDPAFTGAGPFTYHFTPGTANGHIHGMDDASRGSSFVLGAGTSMGDQASDSIGSHGAIFSQTSLTPGTTKFQTKLTGFDTNNKQGSLYFSMILGLLGS
jgi:hypothetical protein